MNAGQIASMLGQKISANELDSVLIAELVSEVPTTELESFYADVVFDRDGLSKSTTAMVTMPILYKYTQKYSTRALEANVAKVMKQILDIATKNPKASDLAINGKPIMAAEKLQWFLDNHAFTELENEIKAVMKNNIKAIGEKCK